jgi:selenocysteine lyase/cysteine desulfurase
MTLDRRAFLGAASAAASLPLLAARSRGADSSDPLGVRRDFPVTAEDGIYLNSAYITPCPGSVVAAGREFIEAKGRRPISLDDMVAKTNEVREQFARGVGASPEEIGFLSSTSEGENLVAASLELNPGDNLVVDDLHYTTTYVLYRQLQQTRGVELRVARHREGRAAPADFEPLIDGKTRMVSVAWVSHQNGFRHDVKALADLAHAHGAFLYTDAIQAVGMFPTNLAQEGVDFLTTGTYKWLLGGFGVAPFYVRAALLDRIAIDRRGHLHVEKDLGDYNYQLFRSARKFEYATLAFEALYQLGAGLSYLERVGIERIEEHTVALADRLRRGLAERKLVLRTPAGNRSSIVAFQNPRSPEDASRILREARVQVSLREKGTQIRVAPALFNNAEEIDAFLKVAEKLASPGA